MTKTSESRRPVIDPPVIQERIVDAALLTRRRMRRLFPASAGFDEAPGQGEAIALPRYPGMAPLAMRERYCLRDFLDFHDEEFIRSAYLGVLRRPADPSGLAHYLEALRQSRMSKIEILGHIRYSGEGRAANVQVDGLRFAYAIRMLGKVPVAGYLLRLVRALVCLPVLLRQHEEFQRFVMTRFTERDSHGNHSAEVVEAALRHLGRQVTEKAEATALKDFRRELLATIEERDARTATAYAPQHEFEALRRQTRQEFERLRKERGDYSDASFLNFYRALEDAFRGDRQMVMRSQEHYLSCIRQARVADPSAPVLDIGSGRGEWLELLQRAGIRACGVDINGKQVEACKSRGLEVTHGDALEYLRRQPSGSLRAVTGFHIVEHFPLPMLLALLTESHRVLQEGGVAIFETPNPANVFVGSCSFHYDPTHHKPVPSPLLKFLLEYHGFGDVRIVEMHRSESQPLVEEREVDRHFNHFFYNAMDYAAVAFRRPSS